MVNAFLLAAEMVLYFSVMAALFRMRHRFGMGVFVCALGTMHCLETYLAAIFYLQFPMGVVVSPGSTVLFAGKLVMLLLVYIREDAAAVRQPIYGLLLGNFLIVALALLMRFHDVLPMPSGQAPDFAFMEQMGGLMLWGTLLLFVDAVLIIVLYEHLGRWMGRWTGLRIWVSAAIVLSFDQAGFFAALHLLLNAPLSVLVGGWVAKMATAVCYSALAAAYLRWFERTARPGPLAIRLGDVFDALTYRERYEDLLEKSARDGLTGVLSRERFQSEGSTAMQAAIAANHPLSLLVIDIDHFKAVNDRFGHTAGDQVLRRLAQVLQGGKRNADRLFRYGGEEFVILSPGLPPLYAHKLAERLRVLVAETSIPEIDTPLTVSIGVATSPQDGLDLGALFASADARLYSAKNAGRNRVCGGENAPWLREHAELGVA